MNGMFAVVGASGSTGGATARALLDGGATVRAVVRDPAKGEPWAALGAQVAVADLTDASSLARAFEGVAGAFVLNPPAYAMPDMFSHAERLANNIAEACTRTRLPRLVVLSSIGAHLAAGHGNIRTNSIFERVLDSLDCPVAFLRPAYFMENWAWVAGAARHEGVLPSFLAPTGRGIAMVSAADIGTTAARALRDTAMNGVIELEGPRNCSPDDAAAAFAAALGRPVKSIAVPEAEWPATLAKGGFSARTIDSWVELFRGFNDGTIAFEAKAAPPLRGTTSITDAVRAIAARA